MKKATALVCFIVICSLIATAEFKYQSALNSIPRDGFYKILLTPEVIANLKGNYSDIRIYDSARNEISYLLTKESAIRSNSYFHEYRIISNQNLAKPAVNQVIIENPLAYSITELYLIVRNSEIEKEITLKGSDDLKNWFIIAQQIPSVIGLFQDETSEIKVLSFPKSNYKYFMLQMNIKREDPLQILKAGIYDIKQEEGLYSDVPVSSIFQSDSFKYKKSFVIVKFDNAFEISKIEFQLEGPKIYQRVFELFNRQRTNKGVSDEFIGHYTLSAKTKPIFEINTIRTNKLLITIINNDDVPLKVKKIRCSQLNVYLTAHLYHNNRYFLKFGNINLNEPNYDLKYFIDSIPKNLTLLKSGIPEKIIVVPQKSIVHSYFNNTFMWIAMVLIIVLLAYLTLKLTKEIK